MAFTATSQQIGIMKSAIDDYCRDCSIVSGEQRLQIAELVSSMFDLGIRTPQDLRRGLEQNKGSPHRVARAAT